MNIQTTKDYSDAMKRIGNVLPLRDIQDGDVAVFFSYPTQYPSGPGRATTECALVYNNDQVRGYVYTSSIPTGMGRQRVNL